MRESNSFRVSPDGAAGSGQGNLSQRPFGQPDQGGSIEIGSNQNGPGTQTRAADVRIACEVKNPAHPLKGAEAFGSIAETDEALDPQNFIREDLEPGQHLLLGNSAGKVQFN